MKFIEEIKNLTYKHGLNIELKPSLELSDFKEAKLEKSKKGLEIIADEGNFFKEINLEVKKKKDITINITQKNSFLFLKINLLLRKNSDLNLLQIQNPDKKSKLIILKNIILEENSWFNSNSLVIGREYFRLENSGKLIGKNAKMEDSILYLAKEEEKFDLYNSSKHSSSETFSDLKIKGIVTDSSKALLRSLIKIEENSKNCEGYEKHDSLILNENAEADSIPNLEIENNDVLCSHGSTIGQIDQEKIFYLMSRGLTRKEAEEKIIRGFFQPLLEKIKNQKIKKIIEEKIKL